MSNVFTGHIYIYMNTVKQISQAIQNLENEWKSYIDFGVFTT